MPPYPISPILWHGISNHSLLVIRITTQREKSHAVITIDGQLRAADLGELRRVRRSARGKVALKLEGLNVCADDGIRLLRDWMDAGATLENATPFLRMMLEGTKT
jgi:hypothetical protein